MATTAVGRLTIWSIVALAAITIIALMLATERVPAHKGPAYGDV